LRFKGKALLLAGVLAVSMFPQISVVSPLFLLLRAVGLIDTFAGLILPYLTFAMPLAIWLMVAFFRELPVEIEEAARLDGAGPLRTAVEVLLPLAAPAIATTAILTFLYAWNEFLFALTFTLGLRIIAGLVHPTTGRVFIGGQEVTHVPPERRDLAMVFQSYALYPHMTVRDNLAFGLRLRRVARSEIDQRVRATAQMLGIAGLLDRMPAKLSGGEQQRVAVGRAIVRHPHAFLFDEPLSNLDPQLRGDTRAELIGLHDRLRATMVYVTHDQEEAMTLGQRIAVLRRGVIEQLGGPIEIYERPSNTFVARFIGSPPMNILEGTAGRCDGKLYFETSAQTVVLAERAQPIQVVSKQLVSARRISRSWIRTRVTRAAQSKSSSGSATRKLRT
jgi:ABC-type sugar transport system ATPase subunit